MSVIFFRKTLLGYKDRSWHPEIGPSEVHALPLGVAAERRSTIWGIIFLSSFLLSGSYTFLPEGVDLVREILHGPLTHQKIRFRLKQTNSDPPWPPLRRFLMFFF